jgi:hypothetical protein
MHYRMGVGGNKKGEGQGGKPSKFDRQRLWLRPLKEPSRKVSI